jgi:hypothetical protein
MIKKEMERFDVVRVKDFKAVVIKYIEALLANQQQVRLSPSQSSSKHYTQFFLFLLFYI